MRDRVRDCLDEFLDVATDQSEGEGEKELLKDGDWRWLITRRNQGQVEFNPLLQYLQDEEACDGSEEKNLREALRGDLPCHITKTEALEKALRKLRYLQDFLLADNILTRASRLEK